MVYWSGGGAFPGPASGYSPVGTPSLLVAGVYTYVIGVTEDAKPDSTYASYVRVAPFPDGHDAILQFGATPPPGGDGTTFAGTFTLHEDGSITMGGDHTGGGGASNPLNHQWYPDILYYVSGASAGNSKSGDTIIGYEFDTDVGEPPPPPDPPPPPPGIVDDVTDADGVFIATVEDAYDKVIQIDKNAPGSGAFKLNRYSDDATEAILKGGNIVKVRVPQIDEAEYIFAFLLESESVKLISSDEEGGEYWQVVGRGVLAYPERAIWLAESFVIPWWIGGTPPSAGDVGQIEVAAGSHVRYTIAGGVITAKTAFSVGAFTAFYDIRKSFRFTSSMGMGTTTRLLVRLSSGPQAGWYLHLFDDGFTDHFHSFALASTILLTDINPTKPGAILYYLWQEATHANRPIHPTPGWTVDFTDTLDSNGDPWTETDALVGMTATLGETYLETIRKLIGTGFLDVVMDPDLTMHAYNADSGVDRSGPAFAPGVVRFVKGVNIADELLRKFSTQPVGTWAEVIGSDSAIAHVELADAASRIPREVSVKGETDDTAALEALGLAELRRQLVLSEGSKFVVLSEEDDEDVGHYLPGPIGTDHGKYWPRDTVTLATGTGESDFIDQDVQVVSVTISEDDAASLDVVVEIGSVPGGILSPAPHTVTVAGRGVGAGITGGAGTDGGGATGGSGLVSHDDLVGLGNDDHPQYTTDAEAKALARASAVFAFGDGSAVIAVGAEVSLAIPRGTAWVIEYATSEGGPSGSITWDVQVAAAAYPGSGQSIINTGSGGVKPGLSGATYAENSIANWTTAIDATSSHRIIRVVAEATPATLKAATLTLHLRRTA